MSTESVLIHHLQAIGPNIDSIMEDYTEESVLFTQSGPILGLDGIRAFFEQFISGSPPELLQALAILRQDVHGEVAYIIWQALPFIPLATDTFVIRKGKIVAQTFAIVAPQ